MALLTRRALTVLVAGAVVVAACGDDRTKVGTPTSFLGPGPSTTVARHTATTVAASTTTRPSVDGVLVAQATVPRIGVYPAAGAGTPTLVLDNPWIVDPNRPGATAPQVFLVQATQPDWVQVLLPVRPNGSTGWVRASDVSLQRDTYRVRVDLTAHTIKVTHHGDVVYQGPIARGAPATPTPTGRYYIRVLIKAINPNTVYGPYAYGLSSHSDVFTSFEGGDGEIGIHGNNDASVLGHDVTHGCIRIDNDAITRLAKLLPLGTPVDVVA